MTDANDKKNLRTLMRGAYDIQALRIQMGNRIVGNYKAKLGQQPGTKEDDMDDDAKEILEVLRLSYSRLADGLVAKRGRKPAQFIGDEVISTYTEFCLMEQYVKLQDSETEHFAKLERVIEQFPIYQKFLKGVKGCGVAMSAVIIAEIDITRARYPSSLWAYAGLDVGPDGRGRSRRAEHLIDREYVAKDGATKSKKSITFNPFLKTKLLGVLGPCFLRAGNPEYKKIYADVKHRLENHEKYRESQKGHRHLMALRYMIKMFLVDLYKQWRPLEGLEVAPPYHEAKLGMKHREAA